MCMGMRIIMCTCMHMCIGKRDVYVRMCVYMCVYVYVYVYVFAIRTIQKTLLQEW